MTNITVSMLTEMIRLQDEVNTTIDPNWKETKNPFLRAAHIEIVEAIDHYGWKWWKKQTPDIPAVQMELVDIWHFFLSDLILVHGNSSHKDIAELCFREINSDVPSTGLGFIEVMEMLAIRCLSKMGVGVSTFTEAMSLVNFSWTDMYKWYIGKNMLNTFRQENGYKEGTYVKTWIDDREDNDHLTDILNSFETVDTETFYNDLKELFTEEYNLKAMPVLNYKP